MALVITLTEEVEETPGVFKATGELTTEKVSGEANVLVEVTGKKAKLIVNDDICNTVIAGIEVKQYNGKPEVSATKKIAVGTELEFTGFSFVHKN